MVTTVEFEPVNPLSAYMAQIGLSPISLLGINIHPLRVADLHELIATIVSHKWKALILHMNVYGMNLAFEQSWLQDFFNNAQIVFCDGAGVKLGARIQGNYIPERITYADWMWQVSEFAAAKGFSLYFLGALPGVAQKAASKLQEKYPRLQIVGTHHGYFDMQINSLENKALVDEINQLQPNILVLGFGMPLQERWLCENWNQLNVNIALTGGAVFDYISGDLNRAPGWMTNNGFEWMGRLLIEPRRLWRRYLVGNPLFLWRVLKQKYNLPGD